MKVAPIVKSFSPTISTIVFTTALPLSSMARASIRRTHEPTYKVSCSDPTQVLPRPVRPRKKIQTSSNRGRARLPKLLYVVIGCSGYDLCRAGVALIAVNFDHIFPSREIRMSLLTTQRPRRHLPRWPQALRQRQIQFDPLTRRSANRR
jgi:hypothetical protein